jgi:hypothetical protein
VFRPTGKLVETACCSSVASVCALTHRRARVGTEAVVADLRLPHASWGWQRHARFWEADANDERSALRQRSERVIAERDGFDVVIVGGGAAGCVVAARLVESGSRSVLLLEAGPDVRANLPDELSDAWRTNQEFDWGYAAEPDAGGVVEDLRRGRLLGGTSWVTRFALRGSPADYDEWAALGNAGWGSRTLRDHDALALHAP